MTNKIRKTQLACARDGFDPGSIDGMWGPKTAKAVNAWKVWASGLPQLIDVSRAQGRISWDLVAKANIVGVYVKVSEGFHLDTRAVEHLTGAHNHGLLVGAYHVTRPKNDEVKEVQFFRETVERYGSAIGIDRWLPPMLDVEVDDPTTAQSDTQLDTLIASVMGLFGRFPFVYSYGPFMTSRNLTPDRCHYWHAEYTINPPVWLPSQIKTWKIHQYAGNNGRCPGVKVACDRNRFNGNLEELRSLSQAL